MENSKKKSGLLMVGAAIAVFAICSLIQSAGGSNMFSHSYYPPDSFLLDLAIQIAFWPGWLLTGALLLLGVLSLFAKETHESP